MTWEGEKHVVVIWINNKSTCWSSSWIVSSHSSTYHQSCSWFESGALSFGLLIDTHQQSFEVLELLIQFWKQSVQSSLSVLLLNWIIYTVNICPVWDFNQLNYRFVSSCISTSWVIFGHPSPVRSWALADSHHLYFFKLTVGSRSCPDCQTVASLLYFQDRTMVNSHLGCSS